MQADFAENCDVAEGRFRHRRVDEEKGDLPEEIGEDETIHARSIMLSSMPKIIARIDIVEGDGVSVIPVDYKCGAVPDIPERAWDARPRPALRLGSGLRNNGYRCNAGAIYYIESKTKVPVEFDAALIAETRSAVAAVRSMADKGAIPPLRPARR